MPPEICWLNADVACSTCRSVGRYWDVGRGRCVGVRVFWTYVGFGGMGFGSRLR